MKVNFSNHIPLDEMGFGNGFGYAAEHITKSLVKIGHELGEENADVQLWWDQPHWIEWEKGQYHIAYFPWESTKLLQGWKEILNTADEIWTPSPIIAEWLKTEMHLIPPVFVFEHGIDDIWVPKKRVIKDEIKFLNLGFEAARKYGPQTLQAFRKGFADREDVSLTLKTYMPSWAIEYKGKINLYNKKIPIQKLLDLFMDHDVFMFVSAGEGFGLPPLQAMATGMPTVINDAWCPYSEFLDPNLKVSSKIVTSPWQDIHPGKMFRPDFDEFIDKMRYVADNYDASHEFALKQAEIIHEKYKWTTLTKEAFDALESRLK